MSSFHMPEKNIATDLHPTTVRLLLHVTPLWFVHILKHIDRHLYGWYNYKAKIIWCQLKCCLGCGT